VNALRNQINAQLKPCSKWPKEPPAEPPVVIAKWRLKRDGSLDGEPQVLFPQPNDVFKVGAQATVQAVKECAPYHLPADQYDAWRDVTWEFDWPVILGLVQR
jgi:colicin import membrane protein